MPNISDIGQWIRRADLPRTVHPVAWWLWAIGLAACATWTTNPLLLVLLIGSATCVVLRRRGDAPWARSFRLYVWLGVAIVVLRVFFRIVFGGGDGSTILFRLPQIPLPQWAAGIRLFGPVSAESLLGGLYNGMQLAAMVICVGSANALANPKRLLKSVPNGLYDVGTAVVVAVSVFPQMAESVGRVRRARRLRGGLGRRHAIRAVAIPVLADALDRSLLLAAAMDSRGYGRHGREGTRNGVIVGTLTIVGMIGVSIGAYNMLGPDPNTWLRWPALIGGLVLGCSGLFAASTRVRTTRYRPDRFDLTAAVVALSGLGAATLMYVATKVEPEHLTPTLQPLSFPIIDTIPLLCVLVAAAPAWLAPPAPRTSTLTPASHVPAPAPPKTPTGATR